jgi:hypothetical protein
MGKAHELEHCINNCRGSVGLIYGAPVAPFVYTEMKSATEKNNFSDLGVVG